jgi:Integrase core domain
MTHLQGQHCDEREEAQEDGGGAGDGPVGPLALGLQTKMRPTFFNRDLDRPPHDDPRQHRLGEAYRSVQKKAFMRSFSSRDECLNLHVFQSVAEARVVLAAYRRQYNEERPHSSLGCRVRGSSSMSGSKVKRNP